MARFSNRKILPTRMFTLLAIVATLAIVVSAAVAQTSPALKKVIAAAQKEGVVKLTWSANSLGGVAAARAQEKGLNQLFGTSIKLDYTIGPSFPALGFRMLQEIKAKRPASADIFVGAVAQINLFGRRGMFQKVDFKSLLPRRITDQMVEADGTALAFASSSAGILYNTKLAPYRPTSLKDMLKPEWKGKIATTPYLANFDFLAATDVWGPKEAIEFARKLNKNISTLVFCPPTERLLTGEIVAVVMDCGAQDARKKMEKGAHVAQVIPKDFAKISYYYFGIPKHAQHVNAAKLYTAFMLTPEGQKILWEHWRADLHLLPNSKAKKQFDDYAKKHGVKFRVYTVKWWRQHPEMFAAKKEMTKILVKSRKK